VSQLNYYQEPNGDYLAVDPTGQPPFDGRAAAIAGLPSSVCSTGISQEFLNQCRPVHEKSVPPEWRKAIDPSTSA
jgi:hypothetical protein